MKSIIGILAIIAISSCQKNIDDSAVCTCKNSDYVVVGTYTGISESACAAKEVPTDGIYCTLE